MIEHLRPLAVAGFVLMAMSTAAPVSAQNQGGILRQYMIDSPASMSIHEEATPAATRPVMAGFNNLVLFDEHVPENSLSSIVPDLATRWTWNEDGSCWQPYVKGLTIAANSIFNGWRMEDVWLDK